jgi:hypothetical protein
LPSPSHTPWLDHPTVSHSGRKWGTLLTHEDSWPNIKPNTSHKALRFSRKCTGSCDSECWYKDTGQFSL